MRQVVKSVNGIRCGRKVRRVRERRDELTKLGGNSKHVEKFTIAEKGMKKSLDSQDDQASVYDDAKKALAQSLRSVGQCCLRKKADLCAVGRHEAR